MQDLLPGLQSVNYMAGSVRGNMEAWPALPCPTIDLKFKVASSLAALRCVCHVQLSLLQRQSAAMAPYILDQHGMIRLDRISMPQGRSALSRLFLPCTGVFMGSKVALRSGSGTKLGQRGDGKKELSWYVKAIADMDKNLQETVSPKWRPGCDKFNSAVARLLSPFTRCISSSIDKLADANWPSFVEAGNILPRGYMNHNRSSDRMEPEVPGKSVTDQGYQHAGRDPWQQRFAEKGVYKEHME